MYHIIYKCDWEYRVIVVPLEKFVDVTAFIEEKINKYNYSLADFKVVQELGVNLETVKLSGRSI